MSTQPIDYAALAKQAGAVSSTPAPSGIDYAALAKQAGAISSIAPQAQANVPDQKYQQWKQARTAFEALPLLQRMKQMLLSPNSVPDPTGPANVPGSFEGHPENIGQYVPATAGRAAEGAVDISRGNLAMGSHKLIQSVMNAAAPMTPIMAAGAPVAAARAIGGGLIGSKLAGATAQGLGATPDQQALASDVGNLGGGFAAASGLPRALLETPIKNLAAKHGETLLNVLEPRKALIGMIKNAMESGVTPETHPATQELVNSALDFLKSPEAAQPNPTTPSYFTTGATPKTNVPLTKYTGRTQTLQDMRDFEFMNRAVNEMNAQTGEGQEDILAAMQKAGGSWRGKESIGADIPANRAATYLKTARNGLPPNTPDAAVAQKAADLKYQDEHLADLLQKSIQQVQARQRVP